MAGAARGRDGRGGSPPCKLAQHDAEGNYSSRAAIDPWRSKLARSRCRRSRGGERSPWDGFDKLHAKLSPHIKWCWDAVAELASVERGG